MQTDDYRDRAAEQQLHRRARQPRSAEPLVDRRHLRQSPGHRRSRRATTTTTGPTRSTASGASGRHTVLSSFVARTETPGVDDDDYAFNVRSRTNVPRYDLELGYQEVGDSFNPGGRLPQPARLSQAGRARADALPAEGLPQPAGAAAARVVPRLLGPRRLPGNRLHAPRQPLAVPQQPTKSTPA